MRLERGAALSVLASLAVIVCAKFWPVCPPCTELTIGFPYRFIGRFGPEANPIAVFKGDGEVINARLGDKIGAFRLRAVGIESVDVAPNTGALQRVSLRP